MEKSNQATGGHFLSGLTVGLFAGAASYYLFATKDGKDIRKKLSKEWSEAKGAIPKIVSQVDQERQDFSFPNFFCRVLQTITEGECLCGSCGKESNKATKKKGTRKRKVSTKKFKGV